MTVMDAFSDAPDSPPAAALSRGEGLSAWRQIADALEAEITGGTLARGARLPTEAELSRRFAVNRHTVRRALSALATRGLVRATQGRGTFVEERPIAYPIGPRTRFSETMSQIGREAHGDLVAARVLPADAAIAEALRIAPGAAVLELVTVHRADGTPISMAHTHVPLPRFKGLDGTYRRTGSLTKAYAKHGVTDYTRFSTRIGARVATPDEARHLDLTPGRVVLVIDSVNVDETGRPIQATRSRFAADRVELVVER
jgi:GntR family phosphonate transport system transcriptional regulator